MLRHIEIYIYIYIYIYLPLSNLKYPLFLNRIVLWLFFISLLKICFYVQKYMNSRMNVGLEFITGNNVMFYLFSTSNKSKSIGEIFPVEFI